MYISHTLMRVLGQSEFQSLNCKSEGILSNLPCRGPSQGSILVIHEVNDQNTGYRILGQKVCESDLIHVFGYG